MRNEKQPIKKRWRCLLFSSAFATKGPPETSPKNQTPWKTEKRNTWCFHRDFMKRALPKWMGQCSLFFGPPKHIFLTQNWHKYTFDSKSQHSKNTKSPAQYTCATKLPAQQKNTTTKSPAQKNKITSTRKTPRKATHSTKPSIFFPHFGAALSLKHSLNLDSQSFVCWAYIYAFIRTHESHNWVQQTCQQCTFCVNVVMQVGTMRGWVLKKLKHTHICIYVYTM